MQKFIIDLFDKAKNNKILAFVICAITVIGSICILLIIFGFGYILLKSPSISEGLGNIEKFIGLIGMPSGIYYLQKIDEKMSKILSKESKK